MKLYITIQLPFNSFEDILARTQRTQLLHVLKVNHQQQLLHIQNTSNPLIFGKINVKLKTFQYIDPPSNHLSYVGMYIFKISFIQVSITQ